MDFAALCERLLKLDTTCLADADKTLRAFDPGLRPVRPDLKFIGQAFTVSCYDDFLAVLQALRDAQPGDVLVVDGRGGPRALAGELFASEARRKGLAGLVIDGAIRDTATIAKLNLPVYSRMVFPVSGTTVRLGQIGVPVTCGGVVVYPGEIVIGDRDGLIVASEAELMRLMPIAEEIQRKEAAILAEIQAGHSLMEFLNLDEHLENVQAGRESRLQFKL